MVELKEGEAVLRTENGQHDRRRAGHHHHRTVRLRYDQVREVTSKRAPSFLDMPSAALPFPSPSTRINKASTARCRMDQISITPTLSSRHRRTIISRIRIRVHNCALSSRKLRR